MVLEYKTVIYNKLIYYILLLGNNVYVRKIIINAYLYYCLKVF